MRKLLIKLIDKLEQLPGKDTKPNFCCFGITDDCILKCQMCYKWKRDILVKSDNGMPSVAQWKDAISSLYQITGEGFLINFGGGEPFLMEEILELVRHAADKGFKTNIATNAFLIDEETVKAIAISGLSTINISLDSFKDSRHDYLRGVDGVYDRVIKAIDYLHRYAPALKKGICCVIYDINIDDIIEFTEAIQRDERLEWIYFMAAMQPNNTVADTLWYKKDEFKHLWPQDIYKVNSVLDSLMKLKNKGYKIVNQIPQLKAFKSYFNSPERFIKIGPCHLSRALHLSSAGDAYICFNHARLGNIKSERLEDLWYSATAGTTRRDISGCRRNCHFLINCFFESDYPFSF